MNTVIISGKITGNIDCELDKNTTTTQDDLQKVERTVYNALGISQNLFNTDGNMSLEKSILNDEGSFRGLLLQIEMFYDRIA